jgi:pimeloyl-ACP methyl ester carboxylesterase
MSVVTLDGEIIHYEVLGRGRPLVFLHGWVGSWRYWVPTMQAASISYRTYALDLWGFGDTAKRPQHYDLESQVNLLDQFLGQMGIAKIALVGHGLGAVVGLKFALRFPQFVDRVLLTGLPLGQYAINPRLRSAQISELVEWLLSRVPGTDSARSEAPKSDVKAIAASLDGIQSVNLMESTQNLVTPCLLVFGANDPAVQTPMPEVLDNLPGQAHYILFEQSGHFPMFDEAPKYNRLLADFLALTSGESPRDLQLKEEWKRRIR